MTRVTTSHGELVGAVDDGIHSFKGIPYAAPVSGVNRWLPPAPAPAWSEPRDATKPGNICAQEAPPAAWLAGPAGRAFIRTLWETEPDGDDCLNLNIWTPSPDPDAKLPVMFWIHGGSFVTGSGSLSIYDGTNLARKDVVVVSINYRLGLMGAFVAPGMFDDEFCSSNRGFRDQIAALLWVQENIGQFGGDPDNVTIFGESAGGQSIAVLLASPAAKGLYRRAIAQSGTPEIGAPIRDHEQFSRDMLEALGIAPGDREALSALTGRDTVKAMKKARKLLARGDAQRYGQLVTQGNLVAYGDDILPMPILDALENGIGADVDLMIGTVREDGRLFPLVMPGPERLASKLCMGFFKGLMKPEGESRVVFERYKAAMPGATNAYIRGQIMTDCLFRRGTVRAAELHGAHAPGKTFLYQFNWSSPLYNGKIGAMHGLDVPLMNQNLETSAPILGDIEALQELSDTVSNAWVSFARDGIPADPRMPRWKTFDASSRATMIFDTDIELQHDVDRELREIWYG